MLLLLCSGCKKQESEPPGGKDASAALLIEVRSLLAERDRKLHGYRIEGAVVEGGQKAPYSFAYRAPNRMVATLRLGAERTFAFDGERLLELVPEQERAVRYDLQGPPEKVSAQLHRIFGSFVPEGFRAPLADLAQARARRVSHPLGPQAVELSQMVADEASMLQVTYLLRWPGMDLLEKRLVAGGSALRHKVLAEHCDERLKLCVPTRIQQELDGAAGALTELSKVELNTTLPKDAFSPAVPEGWRVEERALLGPQG